MEITSVIGAGFGDEGKGQLVSNLVSSFKTPGSTLVIRFNGGSQAGHTVDYEGMHHVFSHFGSGTLQGVPTYWSRFCPVYPVRLKYEHSILKNTSKGSFSPGYFVEPKIFIDPLAPVTTPYDVIANREFDKKHQYGTCGIGVGQTILRHKIYKLYYQDIFYPQIFEERLKGIKHFYKDAYFDEAFSSRMNNFMQCIEYIRENNLGNQTVFLGQYHNMLFEGAQGILLDKDFGFFPNVTRSNTTCKNIVKILEQFGIDKKINVHYIIRAYQTRHGIGYMSNENELKLINNENETNVTNDYQGKFRIGLLDINLLKYALDCDNNLNNKYLESRYLHVSCLNHMQPHPIILHDNSIKCFDEHLLQKVFPAYNIRIEKLIPMGKVA